jgi:YHS domain-containing protein
MNHNDEKEKKCPICEKTIRSDADIHEFCKLCGMGIPDSASVPKIQTKNGKYDYFCCERCCSIYRKNIE